MHQSRPEAVIPARDDVWSTGLSEAHNVNVGPVERALSIVSGAMLSLSGLRRGSVPRLLAGGTLVISGHHWILPDLSRDRIPFGNLPVEWSANRGIRHGQQADPPSLFALAPARKSAALYVPYRVGNAGRREQVALGCKIDFPVSFGMGRRDRRRRGKQKALLALSFRLEHRTYRYGLFSYRPSGTRHGNKNHSDLHASGRKRGSCCGRTASPHNQEPNQD